MTSPFSRCLSVDPYYLTVMETLVLPMRFRDGMAPAFANTYNQSYTAIRAGDYSEALATLGQLAAAAGGADLGLCPATAALVLCVCGDESRARIELDKALTAAPDCGEYHHLAGVLALRRRALETAAACFQDAVRLDPGIGPAWAALALLFALDGQWPAVEQPARRALALRHELGASLVACSLMFSNLFQGRPDEGPFLPLPPKAVPEAAVERMLARLPALKLSLPPGAESRPTIFVACDTVYLAEHALALLLSLEETAADCDVHLHLFNPGAGDLAWITDIAAGLKRIRVSHSIETVDIERFGPAAVYYSCARFCRYYQFVRTTGRRTLMLDADCLFRQPPARLPGWGRPDLDLALYENPTAPPWERFLAWGVLATATPASLEFLAWIALFVGQNLIARKGRWFLDQIALFLAHRSLSPGLRIQDWGTGSFDVEHHDGSIVWTVTLNKGQDGHFKAYKQFLLRRYQTVISGPAGRASQ